MLRAITVTAAVLTFAASNASAQIDAMNYCPGDLPVAIDSEHLVGGPFEIGQATLEHGPFGIGAKVATVETRDLQARAVASADAATGLRPGQSLTPFWRVDYGDVFMRRDVEYCATAPSGARRQATCLSADANGAGRGVEPAQFDTAMPPNGFLRSQNYVRGEVQLGAPVVQLHPRALVLTSLSTEQVAQRGGWPAYTEIWTEFTLEGAPKLRRRAGDPLLVEGGALVVTDVDANDAATLRLMSQEEWSAFSRGKCAEALHRQ